MYKKYGKKWVVRHTANLWMSGSSRLRWGPDPTMPRCSNCKSSYISTGSMGGKETAETRVGYLEYEILSVLARTEYPVSPAQILEEITPGLRDRKARLSRLKRIHDALKRLVRRGIVERVRRGYYLLRDKSVMERLRRVPREEGGGKETGMDGYGARGPRGCVSGADDGSGVGVGGFGLGVVGPFFDNVRGVGVGGVWVGGDRGFVRGWGGVGGFWRVSYAEFLFRVGGLVVPGQVVVYTNWLQDGGGVRVEWRPPRGFVRRAGVSGGLRMYWAVVGRAAAAVLAVLARRAPGWALDQALPLLLPLVSELLRRAARMRRGGRLRSTGRLRRALVELAETLGCSIYCPGEVVV